MIVLLNFVEQFQLWLKTGKKTDTVPETTYTFGWYLAVYEAGTRNRFDDLNAIWRHKEVTFMPGDYEKIKHSLST